MTERYTIHQLAHMQLSALYPEYRNTTRDKVNADLVVAAKCLVAATQAETLDKLVVEVGAAIQALGTVLAIAGREQI